MEQFDISSSSSLKQMLHSYRQATKEGIAPFNNILEDFLKSVNVDDTNDNSICIPGLADGQKDAMAEEITVEPFFVVKTIEQSGEKVFINICGSSKIAAPGEWQEGAPPDLDKSFCLPDGEMDAGCQNLRFSLSCSDPISSLDNRGQVCKVYDVVFNVMIVRHSMVHKQLKLFIINMALTWISQKYGSSFRLEFKLPHAKYKGGIVRKHYIRATKTLVTEIEEQSQPSFPLLVSSSPLNLSNNPKIIGTSDSPGDTEQRAGEIRDGKAYEDAAVAVGTALHSAVDKECSLDCNNGLKGLDELKPQAKLDQPKFQVEAQDENISFLGKDMCHASAPLVHMDFIGRPVHLMVLNVSFPLLASSENLIVCASKTEVHVKAFPYDPITVPLIFLTSPAEAKASFISSKHLLEICLPFVPFTKLLREKAT